jgi:hypothetical protein
MIVLVGYPAIPDYLGDQPVRRPAGRASGRRLVLSAYDTVVRSPSCSAPAILGRSC